MSRETVVPASALGEELIGGRRRDTSAWGVFGDYLSRDRLFGLALTFNTFPALYADRSWVDALARESGVDLTGQALGRSPFWIRHLSDALLRLNDLDKQFDFDFFDRSKRLALLDGTVLRRAAAYVDALLIRDSLRRVIDGRRLTALREAIGSEAYLFALRWPGEVPLLPASLRLAPESWLDPACWVRHAVTLTLSALPDSCPGVIGRLRLKHPRGCAAEPGVRIRLNEPHRLALVSLLVEVSGQLAGDWAWLFDDEVALLESAQESGQSC